MSLMSGSPLFVLTTALFYSWQLRVLEAGNVAQSRRDITVNEIKKLRRTAVKLQQARNEKEIDQEDPPPILQ